MNALLAVMAFLTDEPRMAHSSSTARDGCFTSQKQVPIPAFRHPHAASFPAMGPRGNRIPTVETTFILGYEVNVQACFGK